MKRYKLVKDLPTFNAGDIFIAVEGGNLIHENDNVMAYSSHTLDKFPNILTDWFEEIKEQTRWKPEKDKTYYFITNDGKAMDDMWFYDSGVDHNRFEIGNCFKTREEAERVVEYLKALAVVRGDATSKFVKGKGNWYVYYEADNNRLIVNSLYYQNNNGVFGLPYFATKEDAQRSIKLHKNEWLTIFGIKEEE